MMVAILVNRKVFFVQTSIQFKLTLPGRNTKVTLSNPVTYDAVKLYR